MNLQDFRKLIREMVEEEVVQEKKAKKEDKVVDRLGTFYIVMDIDHPGAEAKVATNLMKFLQDVNSGAIDVKKIKGIYSDTKAANAHKAKITTKVKAHRSELDKQMKEVQAQKEALRTLAEKAKMTAGKMRN